MSEEEKLSPKEQAIQDALNDKHPKLLKREKTRIRMEAMAAYIEGVDCSIEDVSKQPEFKGKVSLSELRKWSSEDDWVGKRKRQLSKVKNKIAKAIGDSLATNFKREFMDLHAVREQAVFHLTAGEVKAKSWENVAKVLMQVNERLSYLQQLMNDDVIDETGNLLDRGKKEEGPSGGAPLTPERARELAAALIAKDRQSLREELNIDPTQSIETSEETDSEPEGDVSGEGETEGNSGE